MVGPQLGTRFQECVVLILVALMRSGEGAREVDDDEVKLDEEGDGVSLESGGASPGEASGAVHISSGGEIVSASSKTNVVVHSHSASEPLKTAKTLESEAALQGHPGHAESAASLAEAITVPMAPGDVKMPVRPLSSEAMQAFVKKLASGSGCFMGNSGEVLGCRAECKCGWSQSCFPKYVVDTSGEPPTDAVDIGVCDSSVWVVVLMSVGFFVFSLTLVVFIRMYLAWREELELRAELEAREVSRAKKQQVNITAIRRAASASHQSLGADAGAGVDENRGAVD